MYLAISKAILTIVGVGSFFRCCLDKKDFKEPPSRYSVTITHFGGWMHAPMNCEGNMQVRQSQNEAKVPEFRGLALTPFHPVECRPTMCYAEHHI